MPNARASCAPASAQERWWFSTRLALDFEHLFLLEERAVFWVTRAKDGMACRVVRRRLKKPAGKILRDDEVVLKGFYSRRAYPVRLRRVEALVEVDGQERVMIFLTNNFAWAPSSVAELYRCRWQIECFFKAIKQTLQLCDFLGNSANAVRWQLWTALLCYVLLRFLAHTSRWAGSFTRLWAVCRSALWRRLDLQALLKSYGTAGGSFRCLGQLGSALAAGLAPACCGIADRNLSVDPTSYPCPNSKSHFRQPSPFNPTNIILPSRKCRGYGMAVT